MSINDLVKEEAQRQIDLAIEEIPSDRSRLSTPIARSRFQYRDISDFLLGFEYGHITGMCACYYQNQVASSHAKVTCRLEYLVFTWSYLTENYNNHLLKAKML